MAKYKVKNYDESTQMLTVGCSCRGKKDVDDLELWRVIAAHDESHDLLKAAKDAIPKNSGRVEMMRAAATWAVENGHIPTKPKGW